jgi:hypothetical protein
LKVRRIVITGGAALAVCGVLGLAPAAVQARSASAATWTRQAPATSPPPRYEASMAYDAATSDVVLFGGVNAAGRYLGTTWIWDGSTWTRQFPKIAPPPRGHASMAYDAATSTVVLFGGRNKHGILGDTWTWDGTTWTQHAPATSPPARNIATMVSCLSRSCLP